MTESRRVEAADLLDFRFPSRPAFAPDGATIAFVVQQADAQDDRYRSNIWLFRSASRESGQLTTGDADDEPLWLDDGRLLFRSGRGEIEKPEERTRFYTISPDGGEASELFAIDRRVLWLRQIDESRYLVLTRWSRPRETDDSEASRARVHVFDEAPIWSNGSGFVEGRARLGIYDTNARALTDLTPETMACASPDLGPNRDRAVFTAVDDLSSKTGLPDGYYSSPMHLGDRALVFGFADPSGHGLNSSPQIYRIEAEGGLAERLTGEQSLRFGVNSIGSDSRLGTPAAVPPRVDAGRFYFVATEGYSSGLYSLDASGTVTPLTAWSGSVDAFDVRDGRLVYVAMRDGRLPELFLSEAGREERVTSLNDGFHESRVCAKPHHIRVEVVGEKIDAWVLLPPASPEAGRPASIPAILTIHGGPRTAYGTVYFHEMQVWAAAGYAVIFANPRGSDGRGDDFADIRGRYGSVDYDDLMTVVDRALDAHPVIDPERLCVTGGSYGGFMANWMIGHTDRFVAAASQRSISNWMVFWGTSDIGYFFGNDQTGTSPWGDPHELWRQSPISYADRVSTPTLFVHSDADYRCWIPDAIQMHTALLYHGVVSRLLWIEGENHELSRGGKPAPRLRRLREVTGWFDRWTQAALVATDPVSR
ncbi:MAG: prolyl oligopeptidase family serine peptidase [Spirochaetota bacterium]